MIRAGVIADLDPARGEACAIAPGPPWAGWTNWGVRNCPAGRDIGSLVPQDGDPTRRYLAHELMALRDRAEPRSARAPAWLSHCASAGAGACRAQRLGDRLRACLYGGSVDLQDVPDPGHRAGRRLHRRRGPRHRPEP